MVEFYQKQPDGSLKGPINWYLFLGWEGEPVTSNPIYKPVSYNNTGVPYTPKTPLAPTLSAVLTSRSTAQISWTPAPGFVGPAIVQWEVETQVSIDNGVTYGAWAPVTGSPFAHDVFSIPSLTVPTHTSPEEKIRFRARAENGDGEGDYSPIFEVQWNGTVVNVPNRPTNLVITNITPTSAQLSWTPSVGVTTDGGTKYGIWSGNTDLNIPIDPNAASFVWSGLPQGTFEQNINVRRFNAAGWSGGSNWVDFTTLRIRTTVDDAVMGQSVPDEWPSYRTQIPAVRIYSTGALMAAYNQYLPRVIAYTDDNYSSGGPGDITMGYVDHVKSMMDDFNSVSSRRSCELHIAYGNEISRGYLTGDIPQTLIDVYAALRQLIWGTTGGVRDYPNASLWIDMTTYTIRVKGCGPRFLPIAQFLDGMACSLYPPDNSVKTDGTLEYGTESYPTGSLWPGDKRNNLGFYIDPVFTALNDWRTNGGNGGGTLRTQLSSFACWEVGIPIHHSISSQTGPWSFPGTLAAGGTDLTQRPRYFVGGARVTGPANTQYNFEGFLNYVWKKCDQEDVSMREQLYWNQQFAAHPDEPKQLAPDHGLTSPDLVTAWYQWHPGYRLADI